MEKVSVDKAKSGKPSSHNSDLVNVNSHGSNNSDEQSKFRVDKFRAQ